jgi:hypothetical protein
MASFKPSSILKKPPPSKMKRDSGYYPKKLRYNYSEVVLWKKDKNGVPGSRLIIVVRRFTWNQCGIYSTSFWKLSHWSIVTLSREAMNQTDQF